MLLKTSLVCHTITKVGVLILLRLFATRIVYNTQVGVGLTVAEAHEQPRIIRSDIETESSRLVAF
jgi:hypothetical protein